MRLFALQGTQTLGQAVARAMKVELDPIEEREFSDWEHKSRPLISVRDEDVYILHNLNGGGVHSPADKLIRLLFFIATCRQNGAARVTAITPYLAFMRKDQQTKPRDPVNTRYVAQLFEAVDTDMVVTLEVHNPAAFQNAFRCRTTHLDMRHLFAVRIGEMSAGNRVVLASPDSGGMRRTRALQEALEAATGQQAELAIMEKHRSEGVVSGDMFAGDVADADVFIVDDMISSGGTMLRTARACRERGARHVYALATHGLFSEGARDLFAGSQFDKVIVSDSVAPFTLSEEDLGGKIEVLSCASLIGNAIQRLHTGGSIHRLLNPQP
jgi:ribose-phosphate pyrophosphokinase